MKGYSKLSSNALFILFNMDTFDGYFDRMLPKIVKTGYSQLHLEYFFTAGKVGLCCDRKHPHIVSIGNAALFSIT